MLNEIEVGLICLSERKKFKEVYEEYFTALKYFAMRYVKDEEVACDLLSNYGRREIGSRTRCN